MSTDLEHQLRTSGTGVTMNRPVEDIIAGGDRLRRRRHRQLALGASAAVAVAAVGASVALPAGTNPIVTPAVASWSGGDTNLTADQLNEISKKCRQGNRLEDVIAEGTMPIAAELRDDSVLAYFRQGTVELACVGVVKDGHIATAGGLLTDEYKPLPTGTYLGHMGFGYFDPGTAGGPVTDLWEAKPVSEEVDRVTAELAGKTFDGTIVDGVVLFWISDPFTRKEADEAVFTAYSANGGVLQRVGPSTYADPPKVPNDDRDR